MTIIPLKGDSVDAISITSEQHQLNPSQLSSSHSPKKNYKALLGEYNPSEKELQHELYEAFVDDKEPRHTIILITPSSRKGSEKIGEALVKFNHAFHALKADQGSEGSLSYTIALEPKLVRQFLAFLCEQSVMNHRELSRITKQLNTKREII